MNQLFRRLSRALLAAVVLLGALTSLCGVSAQEIFDAFCYDTDTTPSVAPPAVALEGVLDSRSVGISLGSITDLAYDKVHDVLYAVDQTYHRILRLSPQGKLLRCFDSFQNNGAADTFDTPTGLYVAQDGSFYVADTNHFRLVQLDYDGNLLRVIGAPVSTVLGDSFVFKPTHLVLDSIGRFYVISTGFNQGVLCLDENGAFLNCTGTPNVTFNLIDYLWKRISTQAQKDRMTSFVPTEYNNIAVDGEDFLFVTCNNYNAWNFIGGNAYLLRRLNAKGEDIIRSDNGFKPYGLRNYTKSGTFAGGAIFEDVLSLENGVFAAVDHNRGRVFVYSGESQLLFEFGTYGDYRGAFRFASALEYRDGTFYIADSEKHTITLYRQNEYGDLLMKTAREHQAGNYEEEERLWNEAMTYNAGSNVALIGMANMEYRNGDYKASLTHFKEANLPAEYSKVFKAYRQEVLNRYSTWLLLGAAAITALLWWLLRWNRRRVTDENYRPGRYEASLAFGRKLVLRPLSRYWDLTWEKKGTLSAALTIFGLAELVMIVEAYGSGYLFAGQSLMLTSPVTVVFKLPLLLGLYCVCNWCVTSLMDGKGTLRNIVMANCYALIPLLYLLPVSILLSNVITTDESSFYYLLIFFAYFWMAVLILCANRQVHDYSMGKAVGTLLLTIIVMVILVFLLVLFTVLMQKMVTFLTALVGDLATRLG